MLVLVSKCNSLSCRASCCWVNDEGACDWQGERWHGVNADCLPSGIMLRSISRGSVYDPMAIERGGEDDIEYQRESVAGTARGRAFECDVALAVADAACAVHD